MGYKSNSEQSNVFVRDRCGVSP